MPETTLAQTATQKKQEVKAIWEFIASLSDDRISSVQIYGNNVQVTYSI